MVRTLEPARESAPWICIRQLEIERHHGVGAGAQDGVDLGAGHGAGKLRELHGKSAAEPATLLGRLHLPQFEAPDTGQQTAGRVLDAQLAQSVAAIVERDHVVEARPHVFHAGDLGEKRGELPDPLFEGMHASQRFRLFLEQLGEVMRHHRGAGTGRRHNALRGFEGVEEMARHGARFVAIAAVEGGLPTAGLALREVDLVAEAFENVGHIHADLGKKLVDNAGDEQRDPITHAETRIVTEPRTSESGRRRYRPLLKRSARMGGRPASRIFSCAVATS